MSFTRDKAVLEMMFQNHGMLEMMSYIYEMQHNPADPRV